MKQLVEIICIIDRSGSMQTLKDDAIGGFNSFLDDQKKLPGSAQLTLVLFDDEYLKIHDALNIQDVPPLTSESYTPRGTTALYDAIGKTVNEVGKRLADTPEHERPNKILVCILTDGHENASTEFTSEKIAEMIDHQKTKYSWEFMFLAANQDAVLTAKTMNIDADHAISFDATRRGMRFSMGSISDISKRIRRANKPKDDTLV